MTPVSMFQDLLEKSRNIVGFTGAGVSTESGIADYRSQDGIWEKFQPVYYDEFIRDAEKRKPRSENCVNRSKMCGRYSGFILSPVSEHWE